MLLAAQILLWHPDRGTQVGGSMPRPARIIQDGTGKGDEVSTGANDCFCLFELGDDSNRDGNRIVFN